MLAVEIAGHEPAAVEVHETRRVRWMVVRFVHSHENCGRALRPGDGSITDRQAAAACILGICRDMLDELPHAKTGRHRVHGCHPRQRGDHGGQFGVQHSCCFFNHSSGCYFFNQSKSKRKIPSV